MVADMMADIKVVMVADMEVDKVADIMDDVAADMFKTKCVKPEMF